MAAKLPDLCVVIEELIANGIPIGAVDERGRTAAQVAQLNNNPQAYEIITKYTIVDQAGDRSNDGTDGIMSIEYDEDDEDDDEDEEYSEGEGDDDEGYDQIDHQNRTSQVCYRNFIH